MRRTARNGTGGSDSSGGSSNSRYKCNKELERVFETQRRAAKVPLGAAWKAQNEGQPGGVGGVLVSSAVVLSSRAEHQSKHGPLRRAKR